MECVTPRQVQSTSFRISSEARQKLSQRARQDGLSATELLERLILEGIDALDHPGIVHRGPPHDRRASLAAGPDVWEIIGRLRELEGAEEDRIAELSEETDLHPRQVRVAVDYASHHPEVVRRLIEENRQESERSQRVAEARRSLLA